MEEFILILRNEKRPDEDQDQGKNDNNIKNWQNWLAGIIAQDKFINGYKLGINGKSLTADNQIISGPLLKKMKF